MKNRTLALITAAIIAAAAITLTASLSFLNSSAENYAESIEQSTESLSFEASKPTNETDETPDDTTESIPEEIQSEKDYGFPNLENMETVKVVEDDYVTWEYVAWHDIVIDVFDNYTGNLVGQVYLTDDELYDQFCKIFEQDFDYTAELFNPNDPEAVPIYLPEAKYRVEFYWLERLTSNGSGCIGSLAFSYGIEENEIYEFTQTGYPLGNGEAVVAFMESLIADEIAKIEAGNANLFTSNDEMAEIIGFKQCWNGTTLPNGEFIEGVDRYTPRFPYIKD